MRSRNLKPAFFASELLADVEPLARILFQGLWCVADFNGNLEYRPRRLKVQVLPYDNCEIKELIDQLIREGLVKIYEVDGQEYLSVLGFVEHQSPHKQEVQRGTNIPVPDWQQSGARHQSIDERIEKGRESEPTQTEVRTSSVSVPNEIGCHPPDSGYLIPDSGYLIPESGFLNPENPTTAPNGELVRSAAAKPPLAAPAEPDAVCVSEPAVAEKPDKPTPAKRKTKLDKLKAACPASIPADKWAAYLDSRKEKNHPMTEPALELFAKAVGKAVSEGHSVETVMDECINAGWRTVKADWIKTSKSTSSNVKAVDFAKNNSAAQAAKASIFSQREKAVINGELCHD